MPADRLFHARLGHSAKVSSLSDLEYRVWSTYVLAADDFGVMRADAVAFQAATDALRARPARVIGRAVMRLVTVGLVALFRHQDGRYLYQPDWQDFQKVRYPLRTLHPLPAEAEVSARTRHLWSTHPGGMKVPAMPKSSATSRGQGPEGTGTGTGEVAEDAGTARVSVLEESRNGSEAVPEDSRNVPEGFRSHARSCETANGSWLTANGESGGGGAGEGEPPEVASRAAAFVERYRSALYPRHRGVAYAPTRAVEAADADAAERLCATYGDEELERFAERFLTVEGHPFLDGRTRTLSMLLSRAPALAEQLRGPRGGRRDGAARSTEPREAYDAVIERAKR